MDRIELDKHVFRYLSALEQGDLDTVGRILGAAEDDAELDQVIQGVNKALAQEAKEAEDGEDRGASRAL